MYDVTASKPTFAEEYAALKGRLDAMPSERLEERLAILDLMGALKLGYLYGKADGSREIVNILGPKAA